MSVIARLKVYNQLDPKQPWDVTNNSLNNCGPACVGMTFTHATGQIKFPDEILDWMHGEYFKGYTYQSDQQRFLQAYGISVEMRNMGRSISEMKAAVTAHINLGKLVIALIFGNLETNTGGHFVVLYGADANYVYIANPWGGTRQKWTWNKLWAEMKSSYMNFIMKGYHRGYRPFVTSKQATLLRGFEYINVRRGPFIQPDNIVTKKSPGQTVEFDITTPDGSFFNGSKTWYHLTDVDGWVARGVTNL